MRDSWKLRALVVPMLGALAGCSVDVDDGLASTEQALDSATMGFAIGVETEDGKSDTAKAKLPVYVEVELVPHTITYVPAKPGVELALDDGSDFRDRLTVELDGKSSCVRLLARHEKLGAPVPMEFAIVQKGDLDPCTGASVPDSAIDFGIEPEDGETCWRPVLRCDPKPCHWVRLTVRRSPGVP